MSSNYPAGVTDAHPHFNEVDCICPPLFECATCKTELAQGDHCEGFGSGCTGVVDMIEREECTVGAEQSCPQHGWCGGCSSRYCEDCNG